MRRIHRKDPIIKYLITGLLVAAIIYLALVISASKPFDMYSLDNGWMLINNGTVKEDYDINKDKVKMDVRGDEITLINKTYIKLDNPALYFRAYHVAMEIYVADELIYESGMERMENNKVVGCGYYIISLPNDYVGKEIRIDFHVSDNNHMSKLEKIYLVDTSQFMIGYIRKNAFGVFTSFLMVTLGILTVVVSMFVGLNMVSARKIFYTGMMALIFGLWSQCYYGYIDLLSHNNVANYYLEYLTLFLLGAPVVGYIREVMTNKKIRLVLSGILGINIMFIIVALILHGTNIIHMNRIIRFYHVIGAAIIFVTTFVMHLWKDGNKKSRVAIKTGIISMEVFLFVEMIMFNFAYGLSGRYSGVLIPLGGLGFILCAILSNIIIIIERLEQKSSEIELKKMAYSDRLTGVSNRKYCEEVMKSIDEEQTKSFAMINIDLNWLKKINDSQGHEKGDEYICSFAQLFSDECGDDATVGRMGGDEFIAIIKDADEERVESIIARMNKKSGNGSKPEQRRIGDGISFAYGYSISSEDNPLSTQEAYTLADNRMYECKKEQKVGRV